MMGKLTREDVERAAELRAQGWTWTLLGERFGVHRTTMRRAVERGAEAFDPAEEKGSRPDDGPETDSVLLTRDDVSRITSLEDLLTFFKVDTERWQVNHFRVNKWEQASNKRGIVPLYQVRAVLGRNLEREAEIARRTLEQAAADLRAAGANRAPLARPIPDLSDGEPVLLEIAAFDPHIGMYAWEQEVGEDYDSSLAVRAYRSAVGRAIAVSDHYPVERILYVVGNDLAHVDFLGQTARGDARGGATTSGTMQDFDSRLPKMFSAIRRVVVEGIDRAAAVAPVDVLIVPGNHDEQTMYRLGEVLSAWYRNDDAVNVYYDPSSSDKRYWPRRRQYYRYGENVLMLTHGVEYHRTRRDPLPLIFATECPPDMWDAEHREIHTGHNHARRVGGYQPERDVSETRAIITRSLPGLTASDSWHYNSGYKHARAAAALVFRHSGGLAGYHEFTP